MADGLNRHSIMGNLGADPELRMTSTGQAVLNFRVATTESYLNRRTNERGERTDWHTVVIWGKRAEALAKILQKGSRVYVEGPSRTTSYEDRDGNKRYKTQLVARNVILSGRRPGAPPAGADEYDGPPDDHTPPTDDDLDNMGGAGTGDDDIPF